MATTITTNNPNGIGGGQTGVYTLPEGANVSAAFAGRFYTDKLVRAAFNSNILGECTMSSWMEEYGGVEYDCHPTYSLLEYKGFRNQIRVKEETTLPANPSTGTIKLSTKDHFVSGAYYLPVVGNTLILPPSGELAEITQISHSAANTTVLTVVKRGAGSLTIAANSELLVVPGKIISGCECPSGQFRVPDLPIEHDIAMIDIADKGSLCGDDLEACLYLRIPFYDAQGNEISEKSPWYTPAQQEMYRGLKRREGFEKLLNPTFGLIPTIKARGIKFTQADSQEKTVEDIRELKKLLRENGVMETEYAIFAGVDDFSQWQAMLQKAGIATLNYAERPLNGCSWINMEYCGIKVEGLTLHIYEDCSFGNGLGLGAAGFVFPNSAIWVPLGERPLDTKFSYGTPNRNGSMNNRKFTTVYFQSIQGKRYDLVGDSNGFLNGPNGRNSFGTGCKNHEWSVESRFSFEVYRANEYIYQGL